MRAWLLASTMAMSACSPAGSPDGRPAGDYVGAARCGECHEREYARWQGSRHAAAARPATTEHVPAGFDGRRRELASMAFAPSREADVFRVVVDDGPGTTSRHRVALVLGERLEQSVVEAERGRLQALPVAFDAGAQEWFDVFPSAPSPDDDTHWTQPGMTANGRCLYCHTTGFQRGYDPSTDGWATTWAEDGVACEACHGAGAEHVARRRAGRPEGRGEYGAVGRGAAMATCGPCHARGAEIATGVRPGTAIEDVVDLELLDTDQFHADGALRGETFEWVAFGASAKAARGVVCQDCHEPHGARLRAEGAALCAQCHEPTYARPSHTHHADGSAGGACTGCHMPVTVFMERDPRHDHRFATPDPLLASSLGAPDACTTCHRDRPASWAAAQVDRWYPDTPKRAERRRAAAALEGGRRADDVALPALLDLLRGRGDPVRRASAARLLRQWAARGDAVDALEGAGTDSSPLVRAATAFALAEADASAPARRATLVRLAGDPVRLVRHEAAFALRDVATGALAAPDRDVVERAFEEWMRDRSAFADVPETHYNAGVFLAARGDVAGAEQAYRRAIARSGALLAARQNLAMLLVEHGRDAEAETELVAALAREPGWPPAAFTLGLLYGRRGEWSAAARALESCVDRDASYPRALYDLARVYVARGELTEAKATLERAVADPSSRADALRELVRVSYRLGDRAAVARWLPAALREDPNVRDDPDVRAALGDSGRE